MNKEANLAFDTLRKALKIAPDSRDVIRAMGSQYAAQKDFRNAESQYRRILDANPKDLEVRADMGDLMLKKGDFRQAEGEYAEIKRRAPGHPLAYVKLSACYMAQQKPDRAIAELESVLRQHPDLWSPMNDLAYLLGDYGRGGKDLDRALDLVQKARSLSPENPAILDTLGWIHYRRGEVNKAIEGLDKAYAGSAVSPVINFHLGMAYNKAGNSEKAREHLRIALASKVSFPGKDEAEKTMAGIH
jgi:tetratricopeptide (TPR) repeat protein